MTDVRGLVEWLRTKPGQFNMASAGIGSASHLAGMLFNTMTGSDALHVPYKGGAAAINALLSNDAGGMACSHRVAHRLQWSPARPGHLSRCWRVRRYRNACSPLASKRARWSIRSSPAS